MRNADGKWVLTEYDSADAVLSLETVNFQIGFPELYDSVTFDPSDVPQ